MAAAITLHSDGLEPSPPLDAPAAVSTLAALPLGARLVLRCRKDWRAAVVVAVNPERITISVHSPSGHTYRVRRLADSPLEFHSAIPLLGAGCWRSGFARYDPRW